MTENTAMPNEYDATHGEADEAQPAEVQPNPSDPDQPGSPTAEELEADGNLYAPAEAGDDEGVDENGDDPDES